MHDSYDYYSLTNLKIWNRKVIYAYWGIIAIYLLFTGVNYFFTDKDKLNFLKLAIVTPFFEFLAVMIFTEIAYRVSSRLLPYYLVISGNLIVAILVTSLYEKTMLLTAFLMPLIISAFYFHKRLIRFGSVVTFVTFAGVFVVLEIKNPLISHSDFIGMASLIVGGSMILLTLMRRGEDLVNRIRESIVSQQELLSEKAVLEHLAKTDSLTGLYNLRAFYDFANLLVSRNIQKFTPMQLVVLDIDNFKIINDTYGHDVGDQILRWLAAKIKEQGDGCIFTARYGGEEFVLICECESLQECANGMEHLRESIAATAHSAIGGQSITVSIGIYDYSSGMDVREWFSGADSALYTAKRSGKNQICSFTR